MILVGNRFSSLTLAWSFSIFLFLIFLFIFLWPFVSLGLVKSGPCYVGLFIGPLRSIGPNRSICFDQLLGSSAFFSVLFSFHRSHLFLLDSTSIYSNCVELLPFFSTITVQCLFYFSI